MAFLDPAAERHAVAFALDPAGFDWEARGVEGDADTLIVMASLLELPEQLSAATRAAWVRLFHAALAAVPVQTAHLTAAHAERWRDHLARC